MDDKHKKSTGTRLNDTIDEMARGLYDIGVIDGTTMRQYSDLDLPEVHDLSPRDIKCIRLREKLSQDIFAIYLNTTVHTIRDWEQGKKHPSRMALKLLNIVENQGIAILA